MNNSEAYDAVLDHVFELQIYPLAELVVATYWKDPLHIQICTIEEMAELTKELTKEISKHVRYGNWKDGHESMAEEIGHVVLMVFSLMIQQGINVQQVLASMRDAVNRMWRVTNNARTEAMSLHLWNVEDQEECEDGN